MKVPEICLLATRCTTKKLVKVTGISERGITLWGWFWREWREDYIALDYGILDWVRLGWYYVIVSYYVNATLHALKPALLQLKLAADREMGGAKSDRTGVTWQRAVTIAYCIVLYLYIY